MRVKNQLVEGIGKSGDAIIAFIDPFLVSRLPDASEFRVKKITGMVTPD